MSDAGTLRGAARLVGDALSPAQKRQRMERLEDGQYEIEKVAWEEFLRRFTWRQGEHVTLLGTTGSGKTTLALEIVERREYAIAFGTKAKDETLNKLLQRGWKRYPAWPPHDHVKRAIIWPDIKKVKDPREVPKVQHEVFAETIAGIYQDEGWCAFIDELQYVTDTLKLDSQVKVLYQQGRSMGISILAGTQRPRFIPLVAYDQATHIFFWRENDKTNLDRISEIGYAQKDLIMRTVLSLSHVPGKGGDFLYLNTRTGEMLISKVELT